MQLKLKPIFAAMIVVVFAPSPQALGRECRSTLRVVGTSMEPLIRNGQDVEVTRLVCMDRAPVEDDLVLFRTGADRLRLIKRVIAVPGDRFSAEDHRIIINGQPAYTTTGTPYDLPKGRTGMIALYEKDYAGIIPPGAYLVMGEGANGTTDSSLFGLINIIDIDAIVTGTFPAAKAKE